MLNLVISLNIPTQQHGGEATEDVNPGPLFPNQSCTLSCEAMTL